MVVNLQCATKPRKPTLGVGLYRGDTDSGYLGNLGELPSEAMHQHHGDALAFWEVA
jgi:hypothetical protein